ncbi:MAG: DUF1090 domain-containing protein [Desulfovibrio sp.]|nr:DUF1090 domain-containing protein [Desulfovibrio sp.]
MNRNIIKFACLCACAVVVAAYAPSVQAESICGNKIAQLEKQLTIARQHNNTSRVAGLERALENVREWCTDENELAEAQVKVLEKQEKVMERQEELEEAVAKNDGQKKIEKRKQKLAEAQGELREAEKARNALKQTP